LLTALHEKKLRVIEDHGLSLLDHATKLMNDRYHCGVAPIFVVPSTGSPSSSSLLHFDQEQEGEALPIPVRFDVYFGSDSTEKGIWTTIFSLKSDFSSWTMMEHIVPTLPIQRPPPPPDNQSHTPEAAALRVKDSDVQYTLSG